MFFYVCVDFTGNWVKPLYNTILKYQNRWLGANIFKSGYKDTKKSKNYSKNIKTLGTF